LQPFSAYPFIEAFERVGRAVPVLLDESGALTLVRTRTDAYVPSLSEARDMSIPDVFVFEPEGSSFRIAQTRDLSARAFSLSGPDVRAYFFLCQAELLTVDASNSLLKILEDTPVGIFFALVTQYPDRILPTIRSRCVTLSGSSLEGGGVSIDDEMIRRIDAYLAGTKSPLLLRLAQISPERPEALALLSACVGRMGVTSRIDPVFAECVARGIEDLSGTTISSRNILDRIFLA